MRATGMRASAAAMRLVLLLLAACRHGPAPPAPPEAVSWLRGQTHLHSGNSGDSRTPPEDVARWYEAHGYDFIVFTDHNFVTALPPRPKLLVIPGVELTQNLRTCEPPPDAPGLKCLLHVNALFAHSLGSVSLPSPASARRADVYRNALDVARGMGAIAQLNHPNFHHAVDAALVIELARRGVLLMEIANQSEQLSNAGDARHLSTEALWDAALTAGATLYGVATDDAHHYYDADAARAQGENVYIGDLGWIMVRARREPSAIRDAIARGDFYASTGIVLTRLERTPDALELTAPPGAHVRFIGAGGKVLAEIDGPRARFPLDGARGGYVRAVISDDAGHRAWTQPVRVP